MCPATVADSSSSPLRYTIDGAAGLLVIELLSIKDGPALLSALGAIRMDPHFRSSLDVCIDCNTLRRIPSCDDVKELARLCVGCPRSDGPSRWALIATWRPLHDAARLFSMAVSAPNVTLRVFQAPSDARMWLSTTKPIADDRAPWIGPSRAINQLLKPSMAGMR